MAKLQPGMIRPLRLTLLYGHLIPRGRHVFHPGGSHPVCSFALVEKMVVAGLLTRNGERLVLTEEGRSFAGSQIDTSGKTPAG